MNKKVIAVDLDHTLYEFKPTKKYVVKKEMKGKLIMKNAILLKRLKKKYGCKLIICSSRWWGDYNKIKQWLDKVNFPYDGIVLGRFKADVYFCDRAVNAVNYDEKEITSKLKD
ncbi:MAG: hypothetical protein ACTSQG_02750 [Promethearchaeota archaeon]